MWSVARLGVVSPLFPRVPDVYGRLPCNFLFVITRSAPSVPFRHRSLCFRAFLFIGDRCTFHAFFWAPVFPIQGHQRHAHVGGIIATSRRLSLYPPAPFGTGVLRVLVRARLSVRPIASIACVCGVPPSVTHFRGACCGFCIILP